MNFNLPTSFVVVRPWGHPKYYDAYDIDKLKAAIFAVPENFHNFQKEMFLTYRPKNWSSSKIEFWYLDDEGDWVPIQSEAEYSEAVKYLHQTKHLIPLKMCFDEPAVRNTKAVARNTECTSKQCVKCSKDKSGEKSGKRCQGSVLKDKQRKEISGPPKWFSDCMQEFKKDLVAEISLLMDTKMNLVQCEENKVSKMMMSDSSESSKKSKSSDSKASVVVESKEASAQSGKMKSSSSKIGKVTGDSGKCAESLDQKSQKLMKKMSKAQVSEKKLKKLNGKLEQLELRRARLLEMNRKRQQDGSQAQSTQGAQSAQVAAGPLSQVMDANVLSGGTFQENSHVSHNSLFTKKWRVMNSGTAPWTEKTELHLAWHTQGLKPLETTVPCPLLKPGQEGEILIEFQAPDFAGLFESYWHFYHDGERFGQWMGCAVMVDPKSNEATNEVATSAETKCIMKEKVQEMPPISMHYAIKEIQQQVMAPQEVETHPVGSDDTIEDRGEYDSDQDDNCNANASHSDNQSSSDSDASDVSDSFVHVPMPECYKYQTHPMFNVQPCQSGEAGKSNVPEEGNVINEDPCVTSSAPTSPTVQNPSPAVQDSPATVEPDSEEDQFEEASGAESNVSSNSTAVKYPVLDNEAPEPKIETSTPDPEQALHILPETLVTGAINVASRALSATEAIMKSLQGHRPTPVGTEPQESPVTTQLSPTLTLLQEMGFTNTNLNMALLAQHSNDINRVVSELVSLGSFRSPDLD